MTLFVGPVAPTGGPAIKNSITLRHLFPEGGVEVVNTYSKSALNRAGSVLRARISCDPQMIVAVSRKGRRLLWPLAASRAKADSRFRYSLICIGGTVAEEAEADSRYVAYMNAATVVAVETEGVAEKLRSLGVRDPHVMTNFVDGLVARRAPRARGFDGTLRYAFLSSVRDKKGVGTMLSAFREALASGIDAELDIYGPIKPDFDRSLLGGIRSDEPISYLGVVANSEVIDVLREHDCFVFPSEYEAEGFPAVLAEAMAASLPILSSDVCYNPEIVHDGRNGWLYPAGDPSALAGLFLRADSDRTSLVRMSEANADDCLRYDAAAVVGGYREALLAGGWSL